MLDRILVGFFILAITLPGLSMLARPPLGRSTGPTGEVHPALHDQLDKATSPLETART